MEIRDEMAILPDNKSRAQSARRFHLNDRNPERLHQLLHRSQWRRLDGHGVEALRLSHGLRNRRADALDALHFGAIEREDRVPDVHHQHSLFLGQQFTFNHRTAFEVQFISLRQHRSTA